VSEKQPYFSEYEDFAAVQKKSLKCCAAAFILLADAEKQEYSCSDIARSLTNG